MIQSNGSALSDAEWIDESIRDDTADESIAIPQYTITSYGIDYDVAGLVRRLQGDEILVPDFQRQFVWSQATASRFIESLLLGLPVPGIFLYRLQNDRYQVIDGQQRLRSLRFYYELEFDGHPFKLIRLDEKSKFAGLSYRDLSGADRRRLDNSIIHTTVVRQDKPDDNGSSKYSIFERLNTNAMPLSPQEIRSAIYQGKFNDLLRELNGNHAWRTLFGNQHSRRRDEELILRFLALYSCASDYGSSMKRFLNEFMFKNKNLPIDQSKEFQKLFEITVATILDKFGDRAFKPKRAINAALCDSLMVAVARRLQDRPILSDLSSPYEALRGDPEFDDLIGATTSRPDRLRRRLELATKAFASVE